MIPIFVGYDKRESVAYHTFCQSVLSRSSVPVSFTPLCLSSLDYDERHKDGSNEFTYSRFLVPSLMGFSGWAIFADGDMVCLDDIKKLWDMRDHSKAVMVVQHDYETKHPSKYLGARNENYPRKNWSSLILWNCGHYMNKILTKELIQESSGKELHRFEWLPDERIGDLPLEWNWLAGEYLYNANAKLIHYTLGTPCFKEYARCDHASDWHRELSEVNNFTQVYKVNPAPLVGIR